jgi:hypothetical protein
LEPSQPHVHGPLPETDVAVPALHKLLAGATLVVSPFAAPHAPLTSRLAEHEALVPPFDPAQVQFHGPFPVTAEAVPALHRLVVGVLVKSPPFEEPHALSTVTFDGVSVA